MLQKSTHRTRWRDLIINRLVVLNFLLKVRQVGILRDVAAYYSLIFRWDINYDESSFPARL